MAFMLASASLSCGSSRAGEVATWRYDLDFLSLSAAVSVDTVQAYAFARSPEGTLDCPALVNLLRSGQQLPAATARTDEAPLCEVDSGTAGALEAPFGRYWLLVLARRAGRSWLVGCANAEVTGADAGSAARVPLIPFDATVAIPRTSCPSLVARCAGSCS